MILPKTWKQLKDDFQAWRRGEVRILPGDRGRIYARPYEVDSSPVVGNQGAGMLTITPHRVWKASEQRWYTIDEYRTKFGGLK